MNRPIDERRWREFGNELLAELRSLSATFLNIQEQVKAISEQREARDQREQAAPVLRAELQIPEAVKRNRERDNTKKVRREWIAIGVSVLTLFSVVAYAIINYHMLCEMRSANDVASKSFAQTLCQMQAQTSAQKDAAGAAVSAAKTASTALELSTKQFNASQRPYITLEYAHLIGDFKDGETFVVELRIKNTGRTPALHARVCTETFFTSKVISKVITPPSPEVVTAGLDVGADQTRKTTLIDQTRMPVGFRSAIYAGKGRVYIQGLVKYDSSFTKDSYSLPLCVVFSPEIAPDFSFCELPATMVIEDERACKNQ